MGKESGQTVRVCEGHLMFCSFRCVLNFMVPSVTQRRPMCLVFTTCYSKIQNLDKILTCRFLLQFNSHIFALRWRVQCQGSALTESGLFPPSQILSFLWVWNLQFCRFFWNVEAVGVHYSYAAASIRQALCLHTAICSVSTFSQFWPMHSFWPWLTTILLTILCNRLCQFPQWLIPDSIFVCNQKCASL